MPGLEEVSTAERVGSCRPGKQHGSRYRCHGLGILKIAVEHLSYLEDLSMLLDVTSIRSLRKPGRTERASRQHRAQHFTC